MTPHAIDESPLNNANSSGTTRSRYWPGKDITSVRPDSPWLKRQYSKASDSGHESAQAKAQSPAAGSIGTTDRQRFKRTYENAFDFEPKKTISVKEEPQDDNSTSKAATLTQHFAASKASKSSKPTTKLKGVSVEPDMTESIRSPNVTEKGSRERSAIVATLVHVRDSAVTEAVVAHVLRWARHYAPSGHGDIYDAAFIQSIFADLDAHGIEPGRRNVITEILTRPLEQQLDSLRSSSESLLSCLASINTPQPSSPLTRSSRQAE